ncbi:MULTISPECIES: serine/threonine-protein kinase [unclassified Dolichospermum]|uniref:serine/threonine-protein kinase n=1 Tax=unclassified Dolichospermum TaxID=2622029 RepID=UPI001444AD99|nr:MULTISPECIES: serine/threonine-protein kinase [unclassified Dolichospermum]MTJ17927.1 protein kinase [Dolichospermum sp. UHCC 0299]MTJ40256.1 protein kinase [Dolichospermum sp. UHCC 0406]
MQTWTPNTPLQNGQYIIKRAIGGGGFGETYLAEDTEENRLVVIKTLNREQREKPDFAERQKRFRKEALDLSKCYHPHIVQVYDNFPEDGLWAIVMEHIDGDDLAAYVENYTAENGYLSETEALRYIDQIGQALECVHERKLLHRDVKPNNILLRRESKEAVLIDFGLAREFQPGKIRSMTATKTEGYAPIEQYERRGDFGYYTDVYALAATLYSLLTNRVPIPANYRAEEDVKLSPPQKFNQQISDKVNAAILKGMELEPVNRPQTVREFREILGLVVKPVVNISIPPPVNNNPVSVQERQQKNIPTPQLENSSSFLSKMKEIFIPQNSTPQPINQEVQLKSSCGMDDKKLRDLLKAGKWKEADEETARVMLAVAKREEEGWLDVESIDNFPCEDLRTIDQLWVKYSDGKFGFSVQKRIYQGLGGTRQYNSDIWEKFGDKVGWRKGGNWLYYKDITFDKKAPEGHFPARYGVGGLWGGGWWVGVVGGFGISSLASRLESCNI